MVTVNELITYGNELQSAISGINYNQVVIDDSQLVKKLGQIKQGDNDLLYLVIPSAQSGGVEDSVINSSEMMFLLLRKNDRTMKHEDFVNLMDETQKEILDIERKILQDHTNRCGFMGGLNVSSILIDPIWGLAGCHGWTIKFSLDNNL